MKPEETGNTIKILREKKGYTQKQLADLLFISDKTISKWETRKGIPDVAMLEPLAKALEVSVTELLSGECMTNHNRSSNMLKGRFYVCPTCQNVIYSAGEGAFSCCGTFLTPLQARPYDETHMFEIQKIEQDYYVHVAHSMEKDHFISFFAYITSERVQIVKAYPEQEAETRFYRYGHGKIYFYCNQHGLFECKV